MRYLLLAMVCLFELAGAPIRAADWTIEIIPSSSTKEYKSINVRTPFYIVLTNKTDHDLTLMKEWCSDGYFNLSFDLTDKDGKKWHVVKKPRTWEKNFPDPYLVPSGKSFVLSVTLDESVWDMPDTLNGVMSIQAIYEFSTMANQSGLEANVSGKEKLRNPYRDGKVKSEPMKVHVER